MTTLNDKVIAVNHLKITSFTTCNDLIIGLINLIYKVSQLKVDHFILKSKHFSENSKTDQI